MEEYNPRKQAAAVRVRADKVAFYECQFIGVQDTLLDDSGRHFYHSCVIKGCIDFICGSGQSRFEVRIDLQFLTNQVEHGYFLNHFSFKFEAVRRFK